jgi:YfiH family protein
VHAAFTLRAGGASTGPFSSLNLGAQVGDVPAAVAENRRRVGEHLHLPTEPAWLAQVHGISVCDLDTPGTVAPQADAAITRRTDRVCVIQVADCLPVLLATRNGSVVAAAHAGWRGLARGVLQATVQALAVEPAQLCAWLGPGIGPAHFEVGAEVRAEFLSADGRDAGAFVPNARGRWLCDLYALARGRLKRLGVGDISGAEHCTFADTRFFSYRRDGVCGRMGAFIWLT